MAGEGVGRRQTVRTVPVTRQRADLLAAGKLTRLPERSQAAADKLYLNTVARLCDGLERVLNACANAKDDPKQQVYEIWNSAGA